MSDAKIYWQIDYIYYTYLLAITPILSNDWSVNSCHNVYGRYTNSAILCSATAVEAAATPQGDVILTQSAQTFPGRSLVRSTPSFVYERVLYYSMRSQSRKPSTNFDTYLGEMEGRFNMLVLKN